MLMPAYAQSKEGIVDFMKGIEKKMREVEAMLAKASLPPPGDITRMLDKYNALKRYSQAGGELPENLKKFLFANPDLFEYHTTDEQKKFLETEEGLKQLLKDNPDLLKEMMMDEDMLDKLLEKFLAPEDDLKELLDKTRERMLETEKELEDLLEAAEGIQLSNGPYDPPPTGITPVEPTDPKNKKPDGEAWRDPSGQEEDVVEDSSAGRKYPFRYKEEVQEYFRLLSKISPGEKPDFYEMMRKIKERRKKRGD